jgi:microcystin-dependent protein
MTRLAYVTPEQPPEGFSCRAVFVPDGQSWQAIFTGALYALTLPSSYEQVTGLTPDQVATIFRLMFDAWDIGACPMFAGMIVPTGRSTAPDGWLLCDGAAYLIEQYPALYNAIGTAFGVGDAGTFKVPDLRGRGPIGAGQGSGLTNRALAASDGFETHTLTSAELASHRHSIQVVSGTGAYYGWKPGVTEGAKDGESTGLPGGGGGAHNNMQPFLALTFVIYAGQ